MVVPIYKRLETSHARVQVVQKDTILQLIVYLKDFAHGRCMNFELRSTDTFETFSRSGKHLIRFVDAKFTMPKSREKEVNWEFICLDMPEYPAEHDDIVVGFDTEEGQFCKHQEWKERQRVYC